MREVKIIVEADKEGNTKIEAQGFDNNECLKATKSVEEALGKVGKRTMKAESARNPQVGNKQSVGGK
jgi:hypothetical protein